MATVIGVAVGAVGVLVGEGAAGGAAQPLSISKAMMVNKGSCFFIIGFLLYIFCSIKGIRGI
jgi:hypothetical protein